MNNKREVFLEKQINLYAEIIDKLECTEKNRRQKKDLHNFETLYRNYLGEYKSILLKKMPSNK